MNGRLCLRVYHLFGGAVDEGTRLPATVFGSINSIRVPSNKFAWRLPFLPIRETEHFAPPERGLGRNADFYKHLIPAGPKTKPLSSAGDMKLTRDSREIKRNDFVGVIARPTQDSAPCFKRGIVASVCESQPILTFRNR